MIPVYEVPRVIKFVKTKNVTVVTRGWGEGGSISYCFLDMKFQFGKTKKKLNRLWWLLPQNMNVPNATELDI